MKSLFLRIPAKAILFGEFGVLHGGVAVATTFYSHCFEILVSLQQNIEHSVSIESDFFAEKQLTFSLHNDNKETNFFTRLLFPWYELLSNCSLKIEIKKSYSPALGFGSSSALIAGINKALWLLFYNTNDFLENELFWEKTRKSLECVQKSGSGYDIAVQLTASQFCSETYSPAVQTWIFKNVENSFIPVITPFSFLDDINKYGFFLATHIYSDTKKVLEIYNSDSKKQEFAAHHTALAQDFIKDSSIKNLIKLMNEAKKVALEQGLIQLNDSLLNNFISYLEKKEIPFKTMGAGHGDCLWVLGELDNILQDSHLYHFKIDVPFHFSTSFE